MKLQGRNLSLQMDGEDVKVLHRELSQLGYTIPAQEIERGLFEKGTYEAVLMFQQTRNLRATGVVDEATAKAINDSFIVQGTVRRENQRPLPGAIVRAFDKDLRQEQLLGKTSTNNEGFYKIPYSRDQFRRAEKRNADLIVRVFHPNSPDLCLGVSELIFNAKRVQEVDLSVDLTILSEYEKYLAALDPVLENVPIAELTKKDIAFLSGETGMPAQRIELLVTAARLGKKTELPPAAFYGFARMDLPITLSDLLDQDTQILRKALETALERNIIPGALQKDLDRILERLTQLREVDVGIQRKQQKEKIRDLGKVVDLDDGKVEAILKKVSSPAILNDATFATLVKEGELDEDEAKELGLTVSLYGLMDDDIKLTEFVKKGTFPQMPQGKVTRIEDLIAFEKSDWQAVLELTNTEPPDGLNQETYAVLLSKKLENLYPSKTLWVRMEPKKSERTAEDLDKLLPLFEQNEAVFNIDSFDSLKLDEGLNPDEVEKLRESHASLKCFVNRYPGLAIGEILDDRNLLTSSEKMEVIEERIGLFSRFQAQNPTVEFLALDYAPESDDIEALNFDGFEADEQRMVLNTMKAYQRMYSVTNDSADTQMLMEKGYHSVFGIANDSLTLFMLNTGQDKAVAKDYHDRAATLAINATTSMMAFVDVMCGGFDRIKVDNTDPSIKDYLKKIDGWEALFGSLDYCQCQHCRSILSPAAYFVDLMRFVETNIYFEGRDDTWGFRARENHPLHLRYRRPDLWKLPLTCENTNQLIPYLDIINEVLENYIALSLGFDEDDLPEPGEDRSPVEIRVYEELQNSIHSFQQPFSLPLEKLDIYLSHFDVNRGDVARLLETPPDDLAVADLKISQRQYELITLANRDIESLRDLYGIEFDDSGDEITFSDPDIEGSENDVQLILKAMELTRAELGELITTKFVVDGGYGFFGGAEIEIRSEKRVPEGPEASVQNDIERIHGLTAATLERMHRFTRLWRQTPWSIKELHLVLIDLAKEDLVDGIEEASLRYIVDTLSVQKRFNISVEELCVLWSDLPRISIVEGKESLFDRLFNLPDFVQLDGNGRFPRATPEFLHPAFRETPPSEVDYALHRLLAGLRMEDESLYLLITHLSVPFGLNLDSTDPEKKTFPLTEENLSLLYRHARLAEWLRLSIPELFQLIGLAESVTTNHIAGLSDLSTLLKFYDWWKSTNYSLDDFAYIIGEQVENPDAYPDASVITQGILQKVKADQALTFSDTVFAFLEGVTEEQSQAIIEHEDNSGIFSEARGIRYRVSETFDPDAYPVTTIVIPELPDEPPIPATPEQVGNLLTTYHNPSVPVFDDTLFTEIDDVTEEQSRAIIEANPELIVPVPLENTYWLTESFNPTESLTIPDGIPVTETDAKALLLTYHATKVIPNCVAGELGIAVEKTKGLIVLTGIDLTESSFTNALQEGNPDGVILNLVETLLPLTILFKNDAFDSNALDFISNPSGPFAGLDFNDIGIENVQMLSIYHGFLTKGDGEEKNREQLHDVLLAFNAGKFYPESEDGETETVGEDRREKIQTALVQTLDAETVITAHEEIELPDTALEALVKLERCIELSKQLGVGCEVLKLIVSIDYEKLNRAANAIITAFRTKYEDEEKWREKIEPFEDKIRSRRRDALTDYLIHSLETKVFTSLNDLYHYFLIDVELEGCARTSRIVAANSSVQLYVHRVLMHLEQNEEETVQLKMDEEEAKEEWEWRKNYRVWEANRKVFLYPENYIEPDLRDNKTPLFEELESNLLQREINEDTVLDAYAVYMRGFDEVAHLKIAGSYHDTVNKKDILHLLGVTTSDPVTYYYRTIENAYYSGGMTKESRGIIWNPWRRIDVQIPVEKVVPIVYNGRLYIFWVEITTRPENSNFDGGSSYFIGYKHTISLKFTTLRPDGSWTSPQKIKLKTDPFSQGDGVIKDLLFKDFIHLISEVIPSTRTIYGGDWHSAQVTGEALDGEISRIEREIGGSEDGSLQPEEKIQLKFELANFEPIDDYTIKGWRWDQVYPGKTPDGELFIEGIEFKMRSIVDFYRKCTVSWGHTVLTGLPRYYMLSAKVDPRYLWRGRELYMCLPFNILGRLRRLSVYSLATLLLDKTRLDDLTDQDLEENVSDLIDEKFNIGPIARLGENDSVSVVNGSFEDYILDSNGDLLYLQWRLSRLRYTLMRLGTTLSEMMVRKLFANGIGGLLDTSFQELEMKEADLPLQKEHIDDQLIDNNVNEGEIDFTGPFGIYFREIFFHIPFHIANHLNSQQKFKEAQKWYHYIFNPTAKATGKKSRPEDRNWRYLEFRHPGVDKVEKLRDQLTDSQAIETYKRDPFNPHAIARLRLSAYQKSIVMKYIDNLLDWGDELFTQDTMESINEASLLYVLASDILGERPAKLGECGEGEAGAKTYKNIASIFNEENEFLIEMSHLPKTLSLYKTIITCQYTMHKIRMHSSTAKAKAGMKGKGKKRKPSDDDIYRGVDWSRYSSEKSISSFGLSVVRQISPVFCIPANKNLMDYWDRVEDRLHKIRHCMNISGVRRELSLFAPEIDPMLLVRAKAAGLSIEDVLNSISGNLPPYRFAYLIERAKGYAAMLQGFGAALLSALEKKDVEELNQMRVLHQKNVLKLTRQVRIDEYNAAVEAKEALDRRKETVIERRRHYENLIRDRLISEERLQQISRLLATHERMIKIGFDSASAIAALVAQLGALTSINWGGTQVSRMLSNFGKFHGTNAEMAASIAASFGLVAGFKRREEGWKYQRDLADKELEEIAKQKDVAQLRIDIAKGAIDIFEETVTQQDEVYELYRDKFTNLGLYTWLSTNLHHLFREAYNNAYAVAKLAEQAYRFERGDDSSELIGPNHWEASKAGLLAGERLLIDLQNLERKFLETNYRSLEIDQAFSLTQINPVALIQLKETGTCQFEIPEIFFDLFYPGHYRRRIKAARLTIPCITGPYINVSATLTLTGSQMRNEPKLGQEYLLDVPRSRSITIATSTAQNDAGVFELNFRDERYMPFEGAGAISEWNLSLPKNFRQFDYQTINDVILHISYTAEEDGTLREEVEAQNGALEDTIQNFLREESLPRVFSLRQEFSNEFNRLLHSPVDDEVQIQISDKHFPIFLKGQNLNIKTTQLVLRTPKDQSVEGFDISINGDSQTSFVRDTQFGKLPTSENFASLFSTRSILGEHTFVVENAGNLAPAPDSLVPPDVSAIDSDKLTDIYLYLEYGIS